MSLYNQDFQGNVNISRNLNVGSNSDIRGNMTIGHNLVVKGWVDAPNIKGPLKGLYANKEALNESYPNPQPGWFALVGNTLPTEVYRAEYNPITRKHEWLATGERGGEFNLYLDALEQDVATTREEVKDIQELISNGILTPSGVAFDSGENTAKLKLTFLMPDGNPKAYDYTIPIVNEETAGMMSAADKRELSKASDDIVTIKGKVVETILLSEIDSVSASANAYASGRVPCRLIVKDGTFIIGVLDIISDNARHVVSEIFTTHYILQDDGNFNGSHQDREIYIYYRSYSLDSPYLPTGEWTEWRLLSAPLTAEINDSDTNVPTSNAVKKFAESLVTAEADERIDEDAKLKTSLENLRKTLDTLIQGDSSKAIDNFNEIIKFLEGIEDSETLVAKLAALSLECKQNKTELEGKIQAEAQAREAADNALSGKIDAEASARGEANKNHDSKILELEKAVWPLELTLSANPMLIEVGVPTNVTLSWEVRRRNKDVTTESVNTINSALVTGKSNVYAVNESAEKELNYILTAIFEGLTESKTVKPKVTRPSYFGSVQKNWSASENAVKDLTKSLKGTREATYSGISISDGIIVYAYPVSFGELTSIKDGNGYEILPGYSRTTVTVNGIPYYCYYLTVPVTATGVTQIYK